jgi:prophage DNA circulation protein
MCQAHFCSERYFRKLIGKREVEDALERLDRLTQEEAQIAQTELLKIAHNVQECVKGVDDQVQDVTTKVQVVEDKVDVVIDGTRTFFLN